MSYRHTTICLQQLANYITGRINKKLINYAFVYSSPKDNCLSSKLIGTYSMIVGLNQLWTDCDIKMGLNSTKYAQISQILHSILGKSAPENISLFSWLG